MAELKDHNLAFVVGSSFFLFCWLCCFCLIGCKCQAAVNFWKAPYYYFMSSWWFISIPVLEVAIFFSPNYYIKYVLATGGGIFFAFLIKWKRTVATPNQQKEHYHFQRNTWSLVWSMWQSYPP